MEGPAKVAYIFPGQGSQTVGMGKDLCDSFAPAAAIFTKADAVLGFSLSHLCFSGPDDELRLTVNAQPAILTVSLACLQAAREKAGGRLLPPAFVAGHSLGEYTALAVADVIDFDTAIFLARERGRLMHEAGMKRSGGMAAILGMDEPTLAGVCQETGTCIANYNSPGQLVISGATEDIARATELAKARGASRALPLPVSGAFHSPLMQPAREGLAKVIAGIQFRDPSIPIVANTTARVLTSASEVKEELTAQLCNGVQWQRSIEFMVSKGVTTFIEIGPGKVLTGLVKRIDRKASTVNIGDVQSIEALTRAAS